jgi:hypothetical protein
MCPVITVRAGEFAPCSRRFAGSTEFIPVIAFHNYESQLHRPFALWLAPAS